MFAYDMKWVSAPIQPELLSGLPAAAQQMALCVYINHLWNDNGIYHNRIRAKTIKNYVREVAGLLSLSGSRLVDIRREDQTGTKLTPVLQRMFAEIDKFETAPNRREAFTLPMLREALARADQVPFLDHIDMVLADWYEVCLFTGARKSEWAQPAECHKAPGSYFRNLQNDAYAFRMADLRIETRRGERRAGLACLHFPSSDIRHMWITYRMQKNGAHGEERMYTASDGDLSFISAMYRIMLRFRRLLPSDDDLHNPLAVYRVSAEGPVHFVTPRLIMNHMRSVAAVVHRLHPTKDKAALRRWSSHSLRVGACVLLQEAGFSATQIQWLLRWRSQAFMDYLRNLPGLAQQQSHALNRADGVMPNVYAPLGALRG
jgi:hypothetical protein